MIDWRTARLRRMGFELQLLREGEPAGLLVQVRAPDGVPSSLLNVAAAKDFLRQVADRWNAVTDALAILEDPDYGRIAAAEDALVILRRVVQGGGG